MYAQILKKFNPSQPRDENGRFATTGGKGRGKGGLGSSLPSKVKAKSKEQFVVEAKRHAGAITKRAGEVEPQLSKIVLGLANPPHKVQGFKYRLKTEDSLTRKISDEAHKEGITTDQKASEIGDAVRYTIESPPDRYTSKVEETVKQLEAEGHKLYKLKNYWGQKDDQGRDPIYQGVNMNFKAPNGVVWELQVHTPDSFRIKESVNHPLYEEYRELPEGPSATPADNARREKLYNQMMANQRTLEVPKGIENVKSRKNKV